MGNEHHLVGWEWDLSAFSSPGLAGAQGRGAASNNESPRQAGLWGTQRSSLPTSALHNCCLFPLHRPNKSSAGSTWGLCGITWIQQHREDLVSRLTLQPAFTQLDEGIVDDAECFRSQSVWGGRPPKAWEENTCCGHDSAWLPFLLPLATKGAFCHAWS